MVMDCGTGYTKVGFAGNVEVLTRPELLQRSSSSDRRIPAVRNMFHLHARPPSGTPSCRPVDPGVLELELDSSYCPLLLMAAERCIPNGDGVRRRAAAWRAGRPAVLGRRGGGSRQRDDGEHRRAAAAGHGTARLSDTHPPPPLSSGSSPCSEIWQRSERPGDRFVAGA